MTDLCYRCGGSGLYMGNGMIMTPCDKCPEKSQITKVIPQARQSLDNVDRRSKSYRDTIKNIMDSSNISHSEAVKVFDETYEKI